MDKDHLVHIRRRADNFAAGSVLAPSSQPTASATVVHSPTHGDPYSMLASPNPFPYNTPSATLVGLLVLSFIALVATLIDSAIFLPRRHRHLITAKNSSVGAHGDVSKPPPASQDNTPSTLSNPIEVQGVIHQDDFYPSRTTKVLVDRQNTLMRYGRTAKTNLSPWQHKQGGNSLILATATETELYIPPSVSNPSIPKRMGSSLKPGSLGILEPLPAFTTIVDTPSAPNPVQKPEYKSSTSQSRADPYHCGLQEASMPLQSSPVLPRFTFQDSSYVNPPQQKSSDPHRTAIGKALASALLTTRLSISHPPPQNTHHDRLQDDTDEGADDLLDSYWKS
ncbi:hypothetical protein BASA50_000968 [Batrachochytrium salamandrivorans]|uniref:Transmembrane protein n=1 Tax=Batrachochytrium salamandrivorans TaxID=1357716 RepID=A0ABQ8ESA9_9FUNG|nr:hypothetical protein BASA60_001574 [Batrachochytrium salamandrivorans]KAH6585807.1 hypothetical protein BASA50_000968 [Batrachochytrium salamandrivorans]KAH6591532.1 hypothetical protein BASA61_004909 [Batrachochytrium salamandrivorans]KAH9269428.1 hypothetical protein BASA83_008511 [Batrachochytrium salamandrivorans]KAJ1341882.1 hypothetical protein BSLG_003535 [Batrachochytrium salamandrivorans]